MNGVSFPRHPWATPIGIFLIGMSLGVVGCKGKEPIGQRNPTAVKVRMVEKSTTGAATRYSAAVKPDAQVELAFRLGGYVQKVAKAKGVDGKTRNIQDGDWVAKNTELAVLRESDYTQRLSEAKAMLAEAMAGRAQALEDLERDQRLSTSEAVSRSYLDVSKTKAATSAARSEAAAARVQQAEQAVADTVLRAPMDGVVLKRTAEVGALAAPGVPLFVIADTRNMKVNFGVPDMVLPALKLGATQAISTEAYPNQAFMGRITRVSPFADPKSRVFEVEVSVPNEQGLLKVGMVASLQLADAAPLQTVTLLPLSSIVRAPGKPKSFAVYVFDEKHLKVSLREVELGDFLGNMIPVKSGLKEGEKVVVMGANILSDGDSVLVLP